jgi:putative membrane protein insertion efficiency factor
MKKAIISCIRFYQRRISPLFGPKCRYYPTCSQYALEAIEVHGLLKGSLLAIRRLMRCNIFFPGGVDPVPPKKEKK